MQYVKKEDVKTEALVGRGIQKVVGKNSYFESTQMSVGYALYNADYGEMEPHCHTEETVIVTKSKDGWIEWGNTKDNLTQRCKLEEGMIFHIPENEWHVFRYEPGGYVEIIFIYGQTDQCRPEDK